MAVLKPIYLVAALGEQAVMPDGAIINIGGVVGPSFTVAGKPLLFADGTATDGSTVSALDFNGVYSNSFGEAVIDFTPSKDLVFKAVNGNEWRFDADTGNVTIGGDLTVLGNATTTINAAINSDRVAIRQTAGNYIPFIMEPLGGVTPTVNVVDIKITQGGASVFTIGPTGATYIQNLTVGSLNGVYLVTEAEIDALTADLAALAASVTAHLGLTDTVIKHTGKQVSVDTTSLPNISGANVQEALESISSTFSALTTGTGGYVRAYEHAQLIPSTTWTVVHNENTRRVQISVWDNTDEMLLPDTISIQDANNVIVSFNTPLTGRAILMLF